MTTLPPPSSTHSNKRRKLTAEADALAARETTDIPSDQGNIRIQFLDAATGKVTGVPVSVPVGQADVGRLGRVVGELRKGERESEGHGSDDEDDEPDNIPYRFTFAPSTTSPTDSAIDISHSLYHSLLKPGLRTTEDLITLSYAPLAVFRVRAVTRNTSSIAGHAQPILTIQASPATGSRFVTGSGDGTARIWDTETGTPYRTLKGHESWVLAVAWSPCGSYIATGSYDNTVRIWTADGERVGSAPLKGHKQWITSLSWEPYHLQQPARPRVASASKDGTVRVWDAMGGRCDFVLARHTASVSCVKWGGTDTIYTSSIDKTVKMWDAKTGALLQNVTSHVHRVNYLALSTDAVLKSGFFDHTNTNAKEASAPPTTDDGKRAKALQRFERAARYKGDITERIATCSDDNKIYLFTSASAAAGTKPTRLDGHQKQVNHVAFSPDGHYLASAGFDNHVILWNAVTGAFVRKLVGHVGPVYQVAWSADSRMLVSGSKDTTVKCWDVRSGRMVKGGDLSGHNDEVFAVEWSGDGKSVGSGGKDRVVRFWGH